VLSILYDFVITFHLTVFLLNLYNGKDPVPEPAAAIELSEFTSGWKAERH
jgi:hypothetical protein